MSRYAALDSQIGEQIATNDGWASFCKWVDSLDPKAYPDLAHMCEYGWDEDLDKIEEQLSQAGQEQAPAEQDTQDVIDGLLAALKDRGSATVLTVTDGLAPDKT